MKNYALSKQKKIIAFSDGDDKSNNIWAAHRESDKLRVFI